MAMASNAVVDDGCHLTISEKACMILETMMIETKLSLEDLIEALFKLYKRSLEAKKSACAKKVDAEVENEEINDIQEDQSEQGSEVLPVPSKTPFENSGKCISNGDRVSTVCEKATPIERDLAAVDLGGENPCSRITIENKEINIDNEVKTVVGDEVCSSSIKTSSEAENEFPEIALSAASEHSNISLSTEDRTIGVGKKRHERCRNAKSQGPKQRKKSQKGTSKNNGIKRARKHTDKKLLQKALCAVENETVKAVENIGYKNDTQGQIDLEGKVISAEESRPYQCTMCSSKFKLRHHLRNHYNVHNSTKVHNCHECKKTFKSAENLKRHVKCHSSLPEHKKYQCDVCDHRCSYESELTKHKRCHTKEKCFKCTICDFATSWEKNLRDHMETHDNRSQYKCQECDYVCRTKPALRAHCKSHRGADHVCEHCGQRYIAISALKDHLNTHLNAKPYKCSECEYSSPFRSNLHKHVLTHKGIKLHQCLECKMSFSQTSHLKAHFKAKHLDPGKVFQCKICDYVTKKSQSFNSHMRIHPKPSVKEKKKMPDSKIADSVKNVYPSPCQSKKGDDMVGERIANQLEQDVNTDMGLLASVATAQALNESVAVVLCEPEAMSTPMATNTPLDQNHSQSYLDYTKSPEGSTEHNYALCNISLNNSRGVAFQNTQITIVPDGHGISQGLQVVNSMAQQHVYPTQDLSTVVNVLHPSLYPVPEAAISLPVVNVQDLGQPQPSGAGYSTYTIHHVVTPQ